MMDTVGKDILMNILCRLPTKPLLRSKCVSKYWYGVISDADFMKSRSRHMILLPLLPLWSIDVNEQDNPNSLIQVSHPLTPLPTVTLVGTFDGVVLLAFESKTRTNMILYNPFTRVCKQLPNPPFLQPLHHINRSYFSYGFGYGLTPKDFKVVVLRYFSNSTLCYVFDGAWCVIEGLIQDFTICEKMATFCNGCLHWTTVRFRHDENGVNRDGYIVALDMTKMVFTEMHIPGRLTKGRPTCLLNGTREGCLSMFCWDDKVVEVWVMKEYGVGASWSNLCSLQWYLPICPLANGKLVTINAFQEISIYDPEKDAYSKVNLNYYVNHWVWGLRVTHCMEYVESLVSPSALFPNF